MSKTKSFDEELKDFRKKERSEIFSKIKHAINIFPEKQEINNSGPDVSTITEHIAFVIDGEVVEIMHCQPKLAAILLSEPQIVRIDDGVFPKPGWGYSDNKFIAPIEPELSGRDKEAVDKNVPTFEEYQAMIKQSSMPTFKEYLEKLKERLSK